MPSGRRRTSRSICHWAAFSSVSSAPGTPVLPPTAAVAAGGRQEGAAAGTWEWQEGKQGVAWAAGSGT